MWLVHKLSFSNAELSRTLSTNVRSPNPLKYESVLSVVSIAKEVSSTSYSQLSNIGSNLVLKTIHTGSDEDEVTHKVDRVGTDSRRS